MDTTKKRSDSITRSFSFTQKGKFKEGQQGEYKSSEWWNFEASGCNVGEGKCLSQKRSKYDSHLIRSASGWTITCFPVSPSPKTSQSNICSHCNLMASQAWFPPSVVQKRCLCGWPRERERMWQRVSQESERFERDPPHHHPAVIKELPRLHRMLSTHCSFSAIALYQ